MNKTKKRSVYYKKVVFIGGENTKTLQEILQHNVFATEKQLRATDREEAISKDSDQKRLINHYIVRSGMFFGQMIAYNAGEPQPFLTKLSDDEFYKVNSISADSINEENSQQKEFIHSILYFGVYKNHLVVMPSQSLRVKSLEHHLSWLLHDYTNALNPEEVLILQDRPTNVAKQKISDLGGAKEVRIGSQLIFEPKELAKTNATGSWTEKWSAKSVGAHVLKALLGAEWAGLNIQNSLDEENVVVEVVVKYKRSISDQGQSMLDEIATSLRHLDEDDFRIKLNNGSTLDGSELKISNTIEISFLDDGYIAEFDLYDEMRKWLMEHYASGAIED
ncbi:hypothetical protein [Suttonella ornithocola]|uniref:Uncharacterized protein n=1 Tax=Suttonella ornithocola TaxID=279832 RepID=A0A380MVW4_9GAMM|nr:hypothetical protein [Suttonella ornithocola]SUO96720.1 Uncharacterised protein [Suttonella ornithocola]